MNGKRYTLCAWWLFVVGVGTLINILLVNIFDLTLPIGSHIGWNFLFTGKQLSLGGEPLFIVSFSFMTFFVSLPFFLCFWQSFKRGGAMLLGFIFYALDTVMLVFDLFTFSNTAARIFLIISLCIHLAGLFFLGYGTYVGRNNSKWQNTVRTLYVGCKVNNSNSRFVCYLNGAFMCTLTAGETKIVVIDHNHQRLSVGSESFNPSEIVIPSGMSNVSVIVSTAYTDKGTSIIITSTNPASN